MCFGAGALLPHASAPRRKHFAEVVWMSPKELMYIEDALSHEAFLATQCQQAAQALQNPDLKQYVNQLTTQHQQLFQKLYQLV